MKTGIPTRPDGKPMWYGRRKTHKLRPNRQRLVDTLLPEIRFAASNADALVEPGTRFANATNPCHLEIGFGAGEHLSGLAAAYPEVNFIGCEPFINGVASLLDDVERRRLTNIRVFDDDARILLGMIADACISRIYILYPDPWPKARHHRRRIMQAETIDALARISADYCELIFASDHMGYIDWTLRKMRNNPDWQWTAERPSDWRRPPRDWIPTRYEAKAISKGDFPAYLVFRRNPRST